MVKISPDSYDFIYLYDVFDIDLSATLEMTIGKYKLTQYKMVEFKDGIPILYQLLRDNIHQNFLREIWMERKNTYICR